MTLHSLAPNSIIMVRPSAFFPNPDTAQCNAFQGMQQSQDQHNTLTKQAQKEFDHTVAVLQKYDVKVHCIQDSVTPIKPDAVFPNNWFSTHADGSTLIYPMFSPSRRQERHLAPQVLAVLAKYYKTPQIKDFSDYEECGQFFEGTGVMCIDHSTRTAYIGLSNRADRALANLVCQYLELKPYLFNTADADGLAVYHTNVMLSIGPKVALIGSQLINDITERNTLIAQLQHSGREVIELSTEQIANFAANAIELCNTKGEHLLALSQRAHRCLTTDQLARLERHVTLVSAPLSTIELAGGSMRCMIAAIHV